MMTNRFTAWLAALNNRDFALLELSGIAFLLVAGWVSIQLVPARLQPIFKGLFMLGGLALYVYLFIHSITH